MRGIFYDFGPVTLDPLRAGETDGRGVGIVYDLQTTTDTVTAINSVVITRQDGAPMVSGTDLALDGAIPPSIDPTGLIVAVWCQPPLGAAGSAYVVTLSVTTAQGRVLLRDAYITVLALMG